MRAYDDHFSPSRPVQDFDVHPWKSEFRRGKNCISKVLHKSDRSVIYISPFNINLDACEPDPTVLGIDMIIVSTAFTTYLSWIST